MPRSYGTTNAAPYAAAPAVGAAGDTYFNTTSKTLFLSDGTAWIQVQGGGGADLSGYFMGQIAGPGSALSSNAWNQIFWTQTIASGMSLGAGNGLANGAINFTQTGRYLAIAMVGYYASNGAIVAAMLRYNLYSSTGTLKVQRDQMGGSGPSGSNFSGSAGVILDVTAGDYLQVYTWPNGANMIIDAGGTRSWINVVPVGGIKGDTGPQGPDITAAQSSYWYGNASSPINTALGNDVQTVLGWTTTLTNGFTLASSNQRITPPSAGRYHVTATLAYNAGAAGFAYTRAIVNQYNSAGTLQTQLNGVGGGGPGSMYVEAVADGVFNVAAGDYFTIVGAIANTVSVFSNNCFCSVVPVGGVKGDIGPTGPQGPAGTGITSAFTARGEWASATAYNPLEIVTRNGVAFLAMSANTNVDPGSLPYGSFAAISDLQAQISGIGKNLAWTPVLRQGGVVPVTINAAWYSRIGEWVIGEFDLYATGAGTGGQTILLDLPVPMRAAGGNTLLHVGTCFITAGGNTYSYALAWTGSTTQIGFAVGGTFYSTAIASGNYVNGFFLYLAPVGV